MRVVYLVVCTRTLIKLDTAAGVKAMNQQLSFVTKQFPSTEQQVWEARGKEKPQNNYF